MEVKNGCFELIFKPKALEDRDSFKKSGNLPLMKKIKKLLEELEQHPETGTGKPEKLREKLVSPDKRRTSDYLYY